MSHDTVEAIEPAVIVLEVAQVAGPRGPAGEAGRDGADGLDGAPGERGPAGEQGLDGPRGADGPRGLPGTPGVDGDEGPRGPAGEPGPEGPEGPRGEQGRNGTDGAPGRDGVDGETGPPGTDGLPGAPGRDGVDGLPGRDGLDGSPGTDGAPGRDGLDGPTGQQGERGAAGPGLPAGGTTGQVPTKASGADHDIVWATPAGGGSGAVSSVNGQTGDVELDAADVGAISSPTITRIITSTDPTEPLTPGDLLIVLPVPRVVASSWSQQTYGGADSITSISATVPVDVKPGDLLIALVGSRRDVATAAPAGWATSATAEGTGVGGVPTGMLRARAYTRTATGTEGGTSATFTQAAAGRMSVFILVVRSGSGTVVIENTATATYGTSSATLPGLHPIPALIAPARGRLAVHVGQCALASVGPGTTTTMTLPPTWTLVTPANTPVDSSPTYNFLRMWVATRQLAKGDSTAGIAQHGSSSHDGGSITLLLAAG